jgi:hypothetical protein
MEDTMTDKTTIRRRPDGSIDTDYYVAKGRRYRSEKAHDAAKEVTKQSDKAFVMLGTLGLLMLFRGGRV